MSATPLLTVPTPADFPEIAKLQAAAFAEKLGCEGAAESERNCIRAYQKYQTNSPQKLEHCRIIKSSDGRTIMAACQLQANGDPGDLTFPPGMRHFLKQGEVYVEWIACHPDFIGKGLGSQLLKWADGFAKHELQAQWLTLSVMKRNEGAVRLYERKGYVIKADTHTSGLQKCISSLFVFCCLGCRYWTVLYMEKDL